MGSVADNLRAKLERDFEPLRLEIVDDSSKHAGHAGSRPGGESHFTITIVSPAFAGLSRIERQRRVYAALKEELSGPVHALALKALVPEEA
jgi:BolA protein